VTTQWCSPTADGRTSRFYDLNALPLYVNGAQVATRAASGSIQTSTNSLWIGGNQSLRLVLPRLIDEARV
jgi:hypothetical protein